MIQTLIGLALSAVGLGYGGYVFWKGQLARASESWPTAPGRILSAEVHEGTATDYDDNSRASVFSAVIRYEYQVRGRTLRGDTICIGGELDTSSRSRAEARCLRYAPGRQVAVHYDPTRPQVCCLETTSEMGPLGYTIGAAFTVLGALISLGIVGS